MRQIGRIAALAIGAVALSAAPALAVTVMNQTDKALEITADLGAEEPTTNVEAGKSAKIQCPEGCEIRATSLNSYGLMAKSGDKIVAKNGTLAYAGSEDAVEASNKDKSKKSTN